MTLVLATIAFRKRVIPGAVFMLAFIALRFGLLAYLGACTYLLALARQSAR